MELIKEWKTLEEIATARWLVPSTILSHVFQIHVLYPEVSLKAFKPEAALLNRVKKAIETLKSDPEAFDEYGRVKLKPLFSALWWSIDYNTLKLALVFVD